MAVYKLSWLVENRVIHLQIDGEYELEVVQKLVAEVKPMVDMGTAPVHVVWDMSGITKMPKNHREPVNEMGELRYHPNGGWITMITNSVMLRFAGQIATVFLGANYRAVASFDEAVETLCRVDQTVVPLLKAVVKP